MDDAGQQEELERIPESRFSRRPVIEKWLRPGIVLVLLIWGSVMLLKTVSLLLDGSSQHADNDLNPNVTDSGMLKVSFDNLRNATFEPASVKVVLWGQDVEELFLSQKGNKFAIRSALSEDYQETVLDSEYLTYNGKNLTVNEVIPSFDLKSFVFKTNSSTKWRHSSVATYFILHEGLISVIGEHISTLLWSPDNRNIAYVQNNNIHIYSLEQKKTIKAVTTDGSQSLFNGVGDWGYSEELLLTGIAMWWSPSGNRLAYLKIDESSVGEYTIPYYAQDSHDLYPIIETVKYSKVGTANPVADIYIYDISKQNTFSTKINEGHEEDPYLFTEVLWAGDTVLLSKYTDRSADILYVSKTDCTKKITSLVREHEANNGSWWEPTDHLFSLSVSKENDIEGYLDIIPIDGFNHLVYYSEADSSTPRVLTSGEWEVVEKPLGFNPETKAVYFKATKKSSTERHIYSVNLETPHDVKEITKTSEPGVYDLSVSSRGNYGVLSYQGPKVPCQKIIHLGESNANNIEPVVMYSLETNDELLKRLEKYFVPEKKFSELDLTDDEESIFANSFEILPPDFDSSKKNHYPVFFFVYGGPNSQQVIQNYKIGFVEVVASQLNAIVVVVDGRGTGYKGELFRKMVRDDLGHYEAEDQIKAARIYAEKDYVNASKISLFGWSYGGYLTLKTLEIDAGRHFKFGMAVAPVTDWRLYDSFYTERYMHTPDVNSQGYKSSSLLSNVSGLKDVQRFLIMHGSGDDNVHLQHSMKFVDVLDLHSIENYDMHIFPDSDHSIKYHNANMIIYDKLLNWTKRAFRGEFT